MNKHQVLHLEEDLDKARLRIYKLEQRGVPDRLPFNTEYSQFTEPLRLRYFWIAKQFRKFIRGLQEQYGVYA